MTANISLNKLLKVASLFQQSGAPCCLGNKPQGQWNDMYRLRAAINQ